MAADVQVMKRRVDQRIAAVTEEMDRQASLLDRVERTSAAGFAELTRGVTNVVEGIGFIKMDMDFTEHDRLAIKQDMPTYLSLVPPVAIWLNRSMKEDSSVDLKQILSAMNEGFAQINGRLDSNESQLAGFKEEINGRLDKVEAQMADTRHDVAELKNDVSSLKKDMATVKEDVSHLKNDVEATMHDVSQLKRDVASTKNNVAQLQGDVETTKNNVTQLTGDVEYIKADVGSVKDDIAEMTRDRTSSYQTIGEQLSDLAEHGQEIDRRFDKLDNTLENYQRDLHHEEGARASLESAVERLTTRVTIVEQQVGLHQQAA